VAEKNERAIKVVAENRKARFNYAVEDTVEAGIALTGTEVKSLRAGKSTIAESYADSRNGCSMPTFRNICRPTASTTSRSGLASCCCTRSRSTA
jgi:tmRNA-binding protein